MFEIHVTHGDITKIACDAIVNAANSSLLGGGGVDGAIHRAAGPELLAECRAVVARQGGCAPGEAVITGAGNLDADYVIHTVGPVWDEGQGDRLDPLLASCYEQSLLLANEYDITNLAFPNISTGVYRYPQKRAAQVAINAVRATLRELPSDSSLQAVSFCCFEADNFALYTKLLG